jgi:hypothetical protein
VFAAEERGREIGGKDSLPHREGHVEYGMVVSVVQPRVVVENINAAEVILDARKHLAHLILVGEFGPP